MMCQENNRKEIMAIKEVIDKNYKNNKYETIYKKESYISVTCNPTVIEKTMNILQYYL